MTKTYRKCRCSARHRSTRTMMQCAIPRAVWVNGRGEYAVIAWCKVPTVKLFADWQAARSALGLINGDACGGGCRNDHDLVRVVLP